MDINAAFPSKWLKAADLKGRSVRVKISHVAMEEVGSDMLPVVYFLGAEKGVVLNKTNSNAISDAYGQETDNWGGKDMEVFPSTTDFAGRVVDCVRMRAAQAAIQTNNTPAPASPPPTAAPAQPAPNGDGVPLSDAPGGFTTAPTGAPEQRVDAELPSDDIPF